MLPFLQNPHSGNTFLSRCSKPGMPLAPRTILSTSTIATEPAQCACPPPNAAQSPEQRPELPEVPSAAAAPPPAALNSNSPSPQPGIATPGASLEPILRPGSCSENHRRQELEGTSRDNLVQLPHHAPPLAARAGPLPVRGDSGMPLRRLSWRRWKTLRTPSQLRGSSATAPRSSATPETTARCWTPKLRPLRLRFFSVTAPPDAVSCRRACRRSAPDPPPARARRS